MNPILVALLIVRGVSGLALESARVAFRGDPAVQVREVTAADVKSGRLEREGFQAIFVSGGRFRTQARALGVEGRRAIRRFVHGGGGYVGICAGSYMALNTHGASIGPEDQDYGRLALAASERVGEGWQRGVRTAWFQPVDGSPRVDLHYANGPVFRPVAIAGMPAVVSLATFESDLYWPQHHTYRGETPGQPAIIATSYGAGRVLLFSPNPQIPGPQGPARGELLSQALVWAGSGGAVDPALTWSRVFVGPVLPQ